MGQRQEGERRQEHQQAQDHGQRQAQVAPAVEPHALLQVLGDADDVLLGEAVLRRAGDGRRGLAPVVILEARKETREDLRERVGFLIPSFLILLDGN